MTTFKAASCTSFFLCETSSWVLRPAQKDSPVCHHTKDNIVQPNLVHCQGTHFDETQPTTVQYPTRL